MRSEVTPVVPAAASVADETTAPERHDGRTPFPSTGASQAVPADETDDDETPVRRRHPYTWLHLIVLAVVAFVLGFLLVALWNQGRSDATGEVGAAGVVVGLAPPASSAAD